MALPLPGYESFGSMLQNKLLQGFQLPMQAQQLQNALIQSKYLEPLTQANISQKQAEANRLNFKNQNPLYGLPGTAGQIGAAELIRQNPNIVSDPNALNLLNRSMAANVGARENQQSLMAKQAAGYDFNSLPIGYKEYELAQAAGLGYEPGQARELLTSGKTLADLAAAKGFNPDEMPEPIYPLTKAGQTQLKQRQASLAELNKMGKTLSEWAGPYSQQIAGWSPLQLKDALTGQNKDQQAKFLAARMLAPEQAAIRIKAMGGNVGIEAIREMTEKSMMNGKAFQALVKPEVFKQANDLVEQAIYDAVEAANKAALKSVASPKKSDNLIAAAAAVTPEPKADLVQPKFPKNAKKELTYNIETGEFE